MILENPAGMRDRTDGSGTAIFFFFFPYCLILFWSILLLGYVWVRTFFFTFLRPLTATSVRVRVRVRVGLSVSVQVGMPTYLNPFLESWVISTCSTERNLFFLPFLCFFPPVPPSLDGSCRVIILTRFLLHAVGIFLFG